MLRRRPWWLVLSPFAALVVLIVVLVGIAVLGMLGGGKQRIDALRQSPACAATPVAVTGTAPGLTPEQLANAQVIASVALSLGLGRPGVLVGILTANVESDLRNLTYGDRDSLGLFQQRAPWASAADRTDPVKSATLFYTGGQGGQPGLLDFSGWQTMDPGVAMQAVQQSQFAGGTSPSYPAKLALATAATDALVAGQPALGDAVTPAPTGCTDAGPGPGNGGAAPVAFTGASVGATVPDPTGTGGKLTPATAAMYAAVNAAFPMRSASCWDAHLWNPTSDHPLGKACDIYYDTPGVFPTEAERQRGWEVANWIVANAAALNVKYVIWDGQFWQGSWGPYSSGIYDVTDPVGGHFDHIHVSTTR